MRPGRRTVLGAGGLVVLVSACSDLGDGGGPGSPVAEDPDAALLADAVSAERAAYDVLTAAGGMAADPRLASALRAASDGHTAHLDVLDPDTTPSQTTSAAPSADPPAGSGAATRALRAAVRRAVVAEEGLVAAHTRDAVAAQSGPFARLLAGLAAAAAQQAAVLRAELALIEGTARR